MVNKAASICLSASMVTASLFMVMTALVQEPRASQTATATAVQPHLTQDLHFKALQIHRTAKEQPLRTTTSQSRTDTPQPAQASSGYTQHSTADMTAALSKPHTLTEQFTLFSNPVPASFVQTYPYKTSHHNARPAVAFSQRDRASTGQAASHFTLSLAAPAPLLPASLLTKEPLLIKQVSARYPQHALSRNITGFVEVRIDVDASGRVTHTEVVRAVPEGYFEEATLKAVERFQFQPAEVAGVAQPASDIFYRMTFGPQRT